MTTSMARKLKVLVVDDSPVDRMFLTHLLNADPRIQVIGAAANGATAIELNEQLDPEVIVMDVTMPDMDGLETTAHIMHSKPAPIVICTSLHSTDPTISFKAIEAGALALVGKPEGLEHRDHHQLARALADTVVTMSEVKLVRRWPRLRPGASEAGGKPRRSPTASRGPVRLIVIGTSTGGPPVLQTILSRLPRDFPVPLLIVQHIAPGFLPGMASWLQLSTGFRVRIAQHHERPLPGHAYLAPDNVHMGVNAAGLIVLEDGPPEGGLRPAVSRLFASVAKSSFASDTVAVLLTGMGGDGAEELLALRNLGAITIAQDAESSVVHGMPGEAIRLGGATHVLPPESIAAVLGDFVRDRTPA